MSNVVAFPGAAPRDSARYTQVAIILHWLIALLLVAQILGGWYVSDNLKGAEKFAAIQIHKSMGLTILLLSLARLGWRLAHKPPPLPQAMPHWQKLAAHGVHVGLYVLMIGIPLSGWIMISSAPYVVKTSWWGLFDWPSLPLRGLEATRAINQGAGSAHSALVWAMVGLWAIHVAAALKHQFADRDGLLGRMIPFLK
jgi:cytochrome b561